MKINLFEQLSSLKINFHKSGIYCVGQAKEVNTKIFFVAGFFPFKYLGIPVHFRK
jgi:hypothetical protein